MKTIYVIVPYNNPEMLKQEDLKSYQSDDCRFIVTYAKSNLKELNTAAEVAEVTPLVVNEITQAEKNGAHAVIVFAFGDVGIEESKNLVAIPVMGLGKPAVNYASVACDNAFTVIPMQLAHNAFIESLIKEEKLIAKFNLSKHAVNKRPLEMKQREEALKALAQVVRQEMQNNNKVDTLTFACGSVMGLCSSLEDELKEEFDRIKIIDPVEITFEIAKTLIKNPAKTTLATAAEIIHDATPNPISFNLQ